MLRRFPEIRARETFRSPCTAAPRRRQAPAVRTGAGWRLRKPSRSCFSPAAFLARSAMDQRLWQLEFRAQSKLAFGHLSVVGFVVVAGKMQHAMEYQHLELVQSLVAVARGILFCNLGGDGDVAAGAVDRREREQVGGHVCLAKTAFQTAQLEIDRDQYGYS